MRFEPPTEGLAQYERVVWARKQGIGFFLPFSVICSAIRLCAATVDARPSPTVSRAAIAEVRCSLRFLRRRIVAYT